MARVPTWTELRLDATKLAQLQKECYRSVHDLLDRAIPELDEKLQVLNGLKQPSSRRTELIYNLTPARNGEAFLTMHDDEGGDDIEVIDHAEGEMSMTELEKELPALNTRDDPQIPTSNDYNSRDQSRMHQQQTKHQHDKQQQQQQQELYKHRDKSKELHQQQVHNRQQDDQLHQQHHEQNIQYQHEERIHHQRIDHPPQQAVQSLKRSGPPNQQHQQPQQTKAKRIDVGVKQTHKQPRKPIIKKSASHTSGFEKGKTMQRPKRFSKQDLEDLEHLRPLPMPLSEYLKLNRPGMVCRADQRVNYLKRRAEKRRQIASARVINSFERARMLSRSSSTATNHRSSLRSSQSMRSFSRDSLAPEYQVKCKLSEQEMKRRTAKRYNQLPEVKKQRTAEVTKHMVIQNYKNKLEYGRKLLENRRHGIINYPLRSYHDDSSIMDSLDNSMTSSGTYT